MHGGSHVANGTSHATAPVTRVVFSRLGGEIVALSIAAATGMCARTGHAAAPAAQTAPPDLEPPSGLPRTPYAGLGPITQAPVESTRPPESTTWVLFSLGYGGGSSRLGPGAVAAAFEGHLFFHSRFSIGVRLGTVGFSTPDSEGLSLSPDSDGASGRFATGLVGYRFLLSGNGPARMWLHVATGAGWLGLTVHEMAQGQRHDFDVARLLIEGRASILIAQGVLVGGLGVDVLGVPREGFAAMLTLSMGFQF